MLSRPVRSPARSLSFLRPLRRSAAFFVASADDLGSCNGCCKDRAKLTAAPRSGGGPAGPRRATPVRVQRRNSATRTLRRHA